MDPATRNCYERILSARERTGQIRADRIEQVMRLRLYLRASLGELLVNVDPVTGARLAELGTEGHRTHGDLHLAITTFTGQRLVIGVDALGRYHVESIPDLTSHVIELVDISVSEDLGAARYEYFATGADGRTERASADFAELTAKLVKATLDAVESQVPPRASRALYPVADAEPPPENARVRLNIAS